MIVAGGLFVIVILVLAILKALVSREGGSDDVLAVSSDSDVEEGEMPDSESNGGEKPQDDDDDSNDGYYDDPTENMSDSEKLKWREDKLAKRAGKIKSEAMAELEEKERLIRLRELELKADVEAVKPQDMEALLGEREKLSDLIKKAALRFESGDLEERNYKMIVSDYQSKLIELDVQIAKKRRN